MYDPTYRVYEDTAFNSKYWLKKYLGSGAFGHVFLADEVVVDTYIRKVAIKAFRGDRAPLKWILSELKLVCELNHPNILRCFAPEYGELTNQTSGSIKCLGLVMELASGTLEDYMAERLVPEAEAREIVLGIADALSYLHNKPEPLVHRDIKPENILRVGNTWKLADFGIARFLDQGSIVQTQFAGSLAYVPPEGLKDKYASKVSAAWDMWSLGVVIALMMSGEHPFFSNDRPDVETRIQEEDPHVPDLPSPFNEIVRGCLNKERKQRWTAQQVIEALNRSVFNEKTPTKHYSKEETILSSSNHRGKQLAGMVLIIFMVISSFIGFEFYKKFIVQPPPDESEPSLPEPKPEKELPAF